MCDLVCDRYPVLLIMSRFGIALGFGDKTIGEVCLDSGVDTATFLAVVNMHADDKAPDPETISVAALVVRFAGLSQPFPVKNTKKSCPARIFLLRKTAIIRCFLYICKIWVMRDTVCHCHPCDAYESLSEQTENNAFTCHP